jgi:hypothetical protein
MPMNIHDQLITFDIEFIFNIIKLSKVTNEHLIICFFSDLFLKRIPMLQSPFNIQFATNMKMSGYEFQNSMQFTMHTYFQASALIQTQSLFTYKG